MKKSAAAATVTPTRRKGRSVKRGEAANKSQPAPTADQDVSQLGTKISDVSGPQAHLDTLVCNEQNTSSHSKTRNSSTPAFSAQLPNRKRKQRSSGTVISPDGKKSTSINIASSGDGKKSTPLNIGSSEDSKKSTPSNTGSSVEKTDSLSSEKGQPTKLTRRLKAQSSPVSKKGKSLRMLNISQRSKSGTQSSLARRSLRAKSVRALTKELTSSFTTEIKRLSTSDGFWSSKPGSRSSSPLSESLSDASTQKQVGVLKKGGRSSTPDVPSSSAKQKPVNTSLKVQAEKGDAALQKSNNAIAELKRLRTTEGFWLTNAPALPSQTASRDCSPASSISQERGVRQSARSLGKNSENKSSVQVGSSNQTPGNDEATLPKTKIKSKKALSTGATKSEEDQKQISNTSSTNSPQHIEQETPVSRLTKKRNNRTTKSQTKPTQPKQFSTSLKREKALSLVQRSSRFRKTRSVPVSPDHVPPDSNTNKQLFSSEVTTQSGKRARLAKPASDEIMGGGTPSPLKMKGTGLKKKKILDLDFGTSESRSEDSKEEYLNSSSTGTTASTGDATESQVNAAGAKPSSSAEFVLSDLLGSPELKRLNTTAGFWAASPDIGVVLGTNQSRRHRDVDPNPTEGSSKSKQAENGSIASVKSQRKRKLHNLQNKDKMDQRLLHEQTSTEQHLPSQDTLTSREAVTQEKQKPTHNFVYKKNKSKKQPKLPSSNQEAILANVETGTELNQSENSEMDTSVADTPDSSKASVRKAWKRGRRKVVPGEMRTNPVVSSVKTRRGLRRGRRGLSSVAKKSLEIMQNLELELERSPEYEKDKPKNRSRKFGSGLEEVLVSGTKSSEVTELSKGANDLENDDFQRCDASHKDDVEKRDAASKESSSHKRDNLFESLGDLYVPPEESGLDKVPSDEVTKTFLLPDFENLALQESESVKLDLLAKEDKKDQGVHDWYCKDLMVKSRIENTAGKADSEELMVSKIIDVVVDQASKDVDDKVEVENSSKLIFNEVEVMNVGSVDAKVKAEASDEGLDAKLKDVGVKKTFLTDDIPQQNSKEVDQCLTNVISSLTSESQDSHAKSENIVVCSFEKKIACRFDESIPTSNASVNEEAVVEKLKLSGTAEDEMPGVSLDNKSAQEGDASTNETLEVCAESRPSVEMCEGELCCSNEDNLDSSSKGIELSVQVDSHLETLGSPGVEDINKSHKENAEPHTDSISCNSSNGEGLLNKTGDSDLRMPFQHPKKSVDLSLTTSVEQCQEKTQTEVFDSKIEHQLKVFGNDSKEISENVSDSVISDTLNIVNDVSGNNIIKSISAETINLITHSDDFPAVETTFGEGRIKPRRKRKKQTTKFFRRKIHRVLHDFSVSSSSSGISVVRSGVDHHEEDCRKTAASDVCGELLQEGGVGLDKKPLKRVRKRKRNSWKRGVLRKAAKWSKKVSKQGEPATSLVLEKPSLLPSFVSEVSATTKSSIILEVKAKSTTAEEYSPAVKKSLKNMLKKLETNANLANAVLDASFSTGRFLRAPQIRPPKAGSVVRKKPPAATSQEETSVPSDNFAELMIQIPENSAMTKKRRGRPKKQNDESSLPKLTPLHMLPSLRSVNPWNKAPPNLSPQVSAISGTTMFFDLMEPRAAVADGDFVCESVDDTDLHLYLSGVSDEEQSPPKESTPSPAVNFTTEMSALGLKENLNRFLLDTPADGPEPFMDKRSSVTSEKEPKKSGRPKMKGRRGRPPGIPMTDEERRQKEVLVQVSSSDDLLELQNISGDSVLSLDVCGSPVLADPSGLLSGKFSLRKKSTRSPLEMLELKRKREEERYDLEQEKRQARLIHLREKRCARESGDGFSDDGDTSLAAGNIMQCSVVLSDFVKKLQLDGLETCSTEEVNSQDAESEDDDVYSAGYNDDSDDEDWCADLEEQRDEEWSDSRPHIPRLKLKRVLKKGALSQVKRPRARPQSAKEVTQEKQKHQPIKLVIKTEPMSDSSDHVGPKSSLLLDTPRADKSGFESSYVDFLKGKTQTLSEKVSRRKSYSSRFAESETKSANITPSVDTAVEILSLPAVRSSASVVSSNSSTNVSGGASAADILSTSVTASNLPSCKDSVNKRLEASERSKRFSSVDEEDDDILILDLEDGTVDENLLRENLPAKSLNASTITQTSSSATTSTCLKIIPKEKLQINKDNDTFDNEIINDKGLIDNRTNNDKGTTDNGTNKDKGAVDSGTVARTQRSLSNDEMGLMLSSYNFTGSEGLQDQSDGSVGLAAAAALEKASLEKKANEAPAHGISIEFGSSVGEKPVSEAAMNEAQHPQAQAAVSGAEMAMGNSEAGNVAESNEASEILDETDKAVSGGRKILDKVCGGSEILDKEVSGGFEIVNKDVSGGADIFDKDVSGGTRNLNKVSVDSEVLNKEVSDGFEILNEEVCGGSEVSSELNWSTDILAQSRQQAERVLAQSENIFSGEVTLDDSKTSRQEPILKRSSGCGVPAESEEHVPDKASHDNNNVTSVFKSPSSISTKRPGVLTDNSISPKKLFPQDSGPEDWRVKVILHSDKSPSGKYSCKRCGFTTLAKLTIESHIYSHIPGVQFRCAYCESEFSSMAAASSHLKNTHSLNEAKLHISCHIDEKNFYDREAAVFSEENGQQSPVLPNSAITDAGGQSPPLIISLVVSGNVGGGRSGRSSALARRFVCTHCGFSTNVKEDAEHHVLDLHPSQTLFACILCSESNFYTEREIKDHCATVHPSRIHPYRKLPDFYDAEQLSLKGKAVSQDDRENIFERMNSIFQDETQSGPGPIDHRQKAKEYLYLQEGWREKTTVEADSTTADDSTEGQSIPSSPEETCAKAGCTVENEATDHPRVKTTSDAAAVVAVKASEGDADISSSARVMAETAAAAVHDTEAVLAVSAAIQSMTSSQEDNCSSQKNQQEEPPSFQSELDTDAGVETLESSQSQKDKELADCSGEGMGLKIVEVVSLCGQSAEEVEEREDTHEQGLGNQITDTGLSVSTSVNSKTSTSPEKGIYLKDKQELPASRKEITAVVQERKGTTNKETMNASAPSVSTESPITSVSIPNSTASPSAPSLAGGFPLSYKCNACKVHTPYLLMMVKHLKAKHPNMHCFACPYCKSTHSFVSQKQLRQHVKQSHPEKFGRNEISLSEDAKKFVEAMVLPLGPECIRVGSRIVLEEDIHTCTYCQVKMTSLSNVYEHLRSKHSDLFEFVCPVCQSFKSKVLDEISDHCLSIHRSSLDTDKVHVSVPKNLFTALTCISKNGKYIEKALSISVEGTSGSSSTFEQSEAIHGSSGLEKKSSIPHGGQVPQLGPVSSVSRTFDTMAHAHVPIQQVPQPVFAIPLVSAGIGAIPGVAAATRPVFAISSALFDTSTLASAPQVAVAPQVVPIIQSAGASSFLSPLPKPTLASGSQHSILSKQQPPLVYTKPQEKAAGPAKSLPVLNVPMIKPRASTAQVSRPVSASKSSSDSESVQKGLQTPRVPASVDTQTHVSRPAGLTSSIDSLPEDEPNPDAFKIFNLRPTAPLVGLSPPSSSPAASPGAPTVYPPVSTPLNSGYIQGPIAGFPPGMVIAPNLMPLTFPFSQHQPLVPGILSQQQQLLSKSSTSSRHPRMSSLSSSTASQPVSLPTPPARSSMMNATVESAAAAAASLYLKKQREQQKELYLKQRQLQTHRNEQPKAHPAYIQRPSLAGQVYHHPRALASPLTLDQHQQPQHGAINMPRPAMFPSPPSSSSSSSAMLTASSLARTNRGVHKRSSSLYQCPYCPITLKALEVASHIQQHHPGKQVSFRKILDQDRH